MRRTPWIAVPALALVALAAACSSDDPQAEGTPSPTSTPTQTPTAAASPEPTPTPTSTPSATAEPAGAEPPGPVVIVGGYILGWWDGAVWQSATSGDDGVLPPSPVQTGTDYQFLAADGTIANGPLGAVGEGCHLQNNHAVDDPRAGGGIGLPIGYDILPQIPMESTVAPAHVQSVEDWLADRGVADPEVSIDRVIRVDLEGDGRDEVIIEASRLANETLLGEDEGDYSVVLLRVVGDDDEVQTIEIGGVGSVRIQTTAPLLASR